jgi:endonuclease/exonuclease/phosphatase family metal-dependent hydrolase
VLAWNILRGGRGRSERIVDAIRGHAPEVVVLSEYQATGSAKIIESLIASGWSHLVTTSQSSREGGLAVLSATPIEPRARPRALRDLERHYLSVRVPAHDLELRAIYGPLHRAVFRRYWSGLLSSLRAARSGQVLAVGDFNSGSPRNDSPSTGVFSGTFFDRLPAIGFTDLWRAKRGEDAREHTWEGAKHPYRLDHAFGSASIAARVSDCAYSHEERSEAVSDHSILLVDLA